MAGEQIPEAWVEQQVVFELHGGQYRNYGTLHAVSAFGLTIRKNTVLLYGPVNRSGEHEGREERTVPVFYPWHRIEYVRLAEDEEK